MHPICEPNENILVKFSIQDIVKAYTPHNLRCSRFNHAGVLFYSKQRKTRSGKILGTDEHLLPWTDLFFTTTSQAEANRDSQKIYFKDVDKFRASCVAEGSLLSEILPSSACSLVIGRGGDLEGNTQFTGWFPRILNNSEWNWPSGLPGTVKLYFDHHQPVQYQYETEFRPTPDRRPEEPGLEELSKRMGPFFETALAKLEVEPVLPKDSKYPWADRKMYLLRPGRT